MAAPLIHFPNSKESSRSVRRGEHSGDVAKSTSGRIQSTQLAHSEKPEIREPSQAWSPDY